MIRSLMLLSVILALVCSASAQAAAPLERMITGKDGGQLPFQPVTAQIQPGIAPAEPWQVLDLLGNAERQRAVLRVALPPSASTAAKAQAARVDAAWHAGDRANAMRALHDLQGLTDPADIELSLQWHDAVPVTRTNLLAANVRVGVLDSVSAVTLAANVDASRLYTIVSHSSSSGSFHVYRSTDKGDTWTLTQSILAIGSAPRIAVAPLNQHFYVGYIPTATGRVFRVRKFRMDTGVSDTLTNGAYVMNALSMPAADTLREIAAASNILTLNNRTYFVIRTHSKTARLFWSAPTTDSLLTEIADPSAVGVIGGLSITYARGAAGHRLYLSYLGLVNGIRCICVDTTNALGTTLQRAVSSYATSEWSSMSAYGDTVVCGYIHWNSPLIAVWARFLMSYDHGRTWSSVDHVESLTAAAESGWPAVMLEKGQGMALFYRIAGGTIPAMCLVHRTYSADGSWSPAVTLNGPEFSARIPYGVAALGANSWGIVFITQLPPPAAGAVIFAKYTRAVTQVAEDGPELPSRVSLFQNYPNPFNPSTELAYAIPATMRVRLAVYDLLGRQVAQLVDELQPAGQHAARWNAVGQASGMYFSRLEAGGTVGVRKMMLMK